MPMTCRACSIRSRGMPAGLFRLVDNAQNRGLAHPDDLAQQIAQHDGDFVNIGRVFGPATGLLSIPVASPECAPHATTICAAQQ